MKKSIFSLVGSLALVGTSFAGFDVPRHVISSSSLDEAKTEALEKGKPITFVQSDPGTT